MSCGTMARGGQESWKPSSETGQGWVKWWSLKGTLQQQIWKFLSELLEVGDMDKASLLFSIWDPTVSWAAEWWIW